MNYYDDIHFVNCGYSEHSVSCARKRMFEGYYGIQFLHKGKMYARTGDHPPEYADSPRVFITYPGISFDFGSPVGSTRSHGYICFGGPRVQQYLESGLLVTRETDLFRWLRDPELFHRTMCEAFRLLKVPGVQEHARAVLLLEELLLQLQDQPGEPDKLYSHYLKDLLGLRDRIAMEPLKDWNFENEAKRLSLSYVHFRRIFKQATGWPLGAFLLECRVKYAQKKLINTHERISEIAEECGFMSVYHFSRLFRKHCRCSPSDFRRQYGNQ